MLVGIPSGDIGAIHVSSARPNIFHTNNHRWNHHLLNTISARPLLAYPQKRRPKLYRRRNERLSPQPRLSLHPRRIPYE